MTDLVRELRDCANANWGNQPVASMIDRAADEIERLRGLLQNLVRGETPHRLPNDFDLVASRKQLWRELQEEFGRKP